MSAAASDVGRTWGAKDSARGGTNADAVVVNKVSIGRTKDLMVRVTTGGC